MPHAFFTSYARLDSRPRKLRDFVEELRERVRSALGAADAKEVGFFDTEQLETGDDWEKRLGEVARKARILVCLCSNTYFNSEFCAKEWDVFQRRVQLLQDSEVRAIVPVIWDRCAIPQSVSRFQLANDRFPDEYLKSGLLSLYNLKRTRSAVKAAIEELTKTIAGAIEGPPLPPLAKVSFEDLDSSFGNPGPYGLRLAVFHPMGVQWQIAPGMSARRVVEGVASSLNLPWTALKADDQIVASVTSAKARREVVVILTSESEAKQPPWSNRIAALDQDLSSNLVVLIGSDEAGVTLSALEAEGRMNQFFPSSSAAASSLGWFFEHDLKSLEEKLKHGITKVRLALIGQAPGERVTDDVLENAARAVGIPLDSPPALPPPGAAS